MQRIMAYIDGFNLYYGMRTRRWQRYYWLNIRLLIENLLRQGQRLECVKYFTARVSSTRADPDKSKRQGTYIEALQTLQGLHIICGHYLRKTRRCHKCGFQWEDHEEKMTDVNIATELLIDAFDDAFDLALLVSGDGDLAEPIKRVLRRFPQKRVLVAFPPARESAQLRKVCSRYYKIGRDKLSKSQFPDEVTKPDGYILRRPSTWR